MDELRTIVLQNRATTHYLLLKHNLSYKQFPGIYCFNVSDFPQDIDEQTNDFLQRDK